MRILLSTLMLPCLLAAHAASAQTAYPQIAWTQVQGNSWSVWVANLDGTRAVKVATGTKYIRGVDLSPQQGKLAFADDQGLKIVSFATTSNSLQVQSVQLRLAGPYISEPDFTADGSGVLYHQGGVPSSFRLIPVAAGPTVEVCQCNGFGARWLAPTVDGDRFVFRRILSNPQRYEIWSGLIATDGTVSVELELTTASQPFYELGDPDVARTRNSIVTWANYGEAAGPRIIEYDLDTDLITQLGVRGTRTHFSNGDAKVVFITPHAASGDYVSVFDTVTGAVTRATKKGDYGWTDARP